MSRLNYVMGTFFYLDQCSWKNVQGQKGFTFVFIILSCLFLAGWKRADLLALVCYVSMCFVTLGSGVVFDCIDT